MNATKLILFNTSILTSYGTFTYQSLSISDAKELVQKFQRAGKAVESAIGHESTADLLSMLLGCAVSVNRMEFTQTINDLAIIFKLKSRPPEVKILSRDEIQKIGYEFGLLSRTS